MMRRHRSCAPTRRLTAQGALNNAGAAVAELYRANTELRLAADAALALFETDAGNAMLAASARVELAIDAAATALEAHMANLLRNVEVARGTVA